MPPHLAWHLGTMGFSYADWAGVFYPRGVKPGDYLEQYATAFDAVELDTTFHAVPEPERFRRWASVVPPHFRFAVKATRTVTHDTPIDRAGGEMRRFLDAARHLGDKLGVVLLQFPPTFGAANLPRLETFLKTLPVDVRFAAEFRESSWFTGHHERAAFDLLRAYGVAWVAAEYLAPPRPVVVTTDLLYVRWVGQHERFAELNREQVDMTERLAWWKQQIESVAGGVREVWGFFNNDYAGYSVATCNRFKRMIGHPVREVKPRQGELF